ncbi:MAG TPA: hypothetical protein VL863_00095, partial [bacterium]|nr:hypothetical protein [bacterium]
MKIKTTIVASLCALVCAVGLLWWHSSRTPQVLPPLAAAPASNAVASSPHITGSSQAPFPSTNVGSNQPLSREFDLAVNPYAAGLREPGKSKREWDAGYITHFQQAKSGDAVKFELTGGVMAEGNVKIIQVANGQVSYVSGELTAPEAGKFFFLTPPAGGKA